MKLTKSNNYRAFAFNNPNSVHIVEQYHPDVNPDGANRMRIVNEAY